MNLTETWLGVLRPRRLLKAGGSHSSSTALKRLQHPGGDAIQEHEEDEDLDASGTKVLSLLSSPLASANWFTEMLQRVLGIGRGGASEGEDGANGGVHQGAARNSPQAEDRTLPTAR